MIGVASASIASEAGGLGEKGATEGTEKATLERTMAFFEARRRDLEACEVALAKAIDTGEAAKIAYAEHRLSMASAALQAATSALTRAEAQLNSLSKPTVATKGMRNSVRPCTLIRHGSPSAYRSGNIAHFH